MAETFNNLSRIAKGSQPKTAIPQSIMKFVPWIGDRAYTKGIVEFQLPPQEITESKANRYTANEIFGRFEPIRVYAGGEPTTINMTMKYYWLEDSFIETIGTWEGIHRNIKKLKAFTFPLYSRNKSAELSGAGLISRLAPPPTLHLYYGEMFKDVPCVVSRVSINYKGPWNDASVASKAQRMASASAVSYNSQTAQNAANAVGSALKMLSTAASYVDMGANDRNGLIAAATGTVAFDKIFPFETTVDISLETAYPINEWKTYEEISEAESNPTNIVGVNVPFTAAGSEKRSEDNSKIIHRDQSRANFEESIAPLGDAPTLKQ